MTWNFLSKVERHPASDADDPIEEIVQRWSKMRREICPATTSNSERTPKNSSNPNPSNHERTTRNFSRPRASASSRIMQPSGTSKKNPAQESRNARQFSRGKTPDINFDFLPLPTSGTNEMTRSTRTMQNDEMQDFLLHVIKRDARHVHKSRELPRRPR